LADHVDAVNDIFEATVTDTSLVGTDIAVIQVLLKSSIYRLGEIQVRRLRRALEWLGPVGATARDPSGKDPVGLDDFASGSLLGIRVEGGVFASGTT
jgi:hypothetical protein